MARLVWKGPEVTSTIKRAAADGLYEAAEHLLETANRTVPHEEGDLARSGNTGIDRDRLVAQVGYDTPYALRQHEELDWRHAEGRRAKWLELAAQEEETAIYDHIAKKIREAM